MLTLRSNVWLAVGSAGGVCCQSVLVAHARSASRRRRVHSAACDKCANRPSGWAVSGHHKRPNEIRVWEVLAGVWFSLLTMVRPGWCDINAGHYAAGDLVWLIRHYKLTGWESLAGAASAIVCLPRNGRGLLNTVCTFTRAFAEWRHRRVQEHCPFGSSVGWELVMHIIYTLELTDELYNFLLIHLSLVNNVHTGQVTELAIPFQW